MRTIMALVAAGALAGTATGQDWARQRLENSPRHGEFVKVENGGREVPCYVVYPESKERTPAIVVIHEIFGLTDWARGVCDQLAEAGYVAIAPDYLGGAQFAGVDDARRAISQLSDEQVMSDTKAVAEYAGKIPAANGEVAVAGFCWGGTKAFAYASEDPSLAAAFVFYGTGPDNSVAVDAIKCPVYGFYAENDARVNATLPKTEELMKAAGKTFEPVIYAGAGHGFMRAGEAPDAGDANRKAREDAWRRWKELLGGL